MGIVLKQSLNNSIVTYLGFGIGALNTLVLYLNFMSPKYYGLIQVILSAATVLNPILAFGVPNTLVKFYSSFNDSKSREGFLIIMLLLPLVLIVPVGFLAFFGNQLIGEFLSQENEIVKDYIWHIFIIGMSMAYFEVFYAWARVHLKSVFGNFMKEVFTRLMVSTLLILLYFDVLTVGQFVHGMVAIYLLRTIIMKLYAYRLHWPKWVFIFPKNTRKILVYSLLIILGGSVAVVLLEVDKVMINQFIEIENVAYYSVAGFIAMVIAVPSRSMHQITYPMTADLLNQNNLQDLKVLYHKSSLTLFIVSSLIYILILVNLSDMYELMPSAYRNGYFIFIWLGLAKVYDSVLGNNNSILYNSDYYRAVLLLGVLLALMTIALNLWLIPEYGLDGAAIASFSALFIYNTLKLVYVKLKFDMLPFSLGTIKVLFALLIIGLPFYHLNFPFHPIINIGLKSLLIIFIYLWIIRRFDLSEDVNKLIINIITRIKRK